MGEGEYEKSDKKSQLEVDEGEMDMVSLVIFDLDFVHKHCFNLLVYTYKLSRINVL